MWAVLQRTHRYALKLHKHRSRMPRCCGEPAPVPRLQKLNAIVPDCKHHWWLAASTRDWLHEKAGQGHPRKAPPTYPTTSSILINTKPGHCKYCCCKQMCNVVCWPVRQHGNKVQRRHCESATVTWWGTCPMTQDRAQKLSSSSTQSKAAEQHGQTP